MAFTISCTGRREEALSAFPSSWLVRCRVLPFRLVMPVILVVDDEPYSRYAKVRSLGEAGFDVRESSNGADGLRAARQQPDAIILDIRLPDLDGFEVFRRLKAERRHAPSR